MDQIIASLGNLGGLGLLSAALLYLHHNAIKSFRAELQAERKAHQTSIQTERETCERRHEQILEKIAQVIESSTDATRQIQFALREISSAMRMGTAATAFPSNKSLGETK